MVFYDKNDNNTCQLNASSNRPFVILSEAHHPPVIPTEVHRWWTKRRDLASELNQPPNLSFLRRQKSTSPTQNSKLILTLGPLYALEGGCDIYPELSAGSIVYRIADSLTPTDRAVTHTVGPMTLGALLEKDPPSAVILGVEMDFLEDQLFLAAIAPEPQNWEPKTYDTGPTVYFRR